MVKWSTRATCVILIMLSTALAGCGSVPDRSQAGTVIIVATATSNEPGAELPVVFDDVLKAANASRQGTVSVLVPRGGRADAEGDPVPVRVLRDGGDVENDPQLISAGLAKIAADVSSRVGEAASNAPVLDLLTGLTEAAHRAPQSTIIAISSGLQTTGLVDFAGLGWDFRDTDVIDDLRAKGFLPDLSGKKVVFVGLGRTAGPTQAALPEPMRHKVEMLWLDLCQASDAQQCSSAQPAAVEPPKSSVPAKVVGVPTFALPALPDRGDADVAMPTEALFAPDSAELLPQAAGQLAALSDELNRRGATIDLIGHTWAVGPADSARSLSLQRAQGVADALVRRGLSAASIGAVRGVGYDQPLSAGGSDPAQTAAANRVVVLTIHTGR